MAWTHRGSVLNMNLKHSVSGFHLPVLDADVSARWGRMTQYFYSNAPKSHIPAPACCPIPPRNPNLKEHNTNLWSRWRLCARTHQSPAALVNMNFAVYYCTNVALWDLWVLKFSFSRRLPLAEVWSGPERLQTSERGECVWGEHCTLSLPCKPVPLVLISKRWAASSISLSKPQTFIGWDFTAALFRLIDLCINSCTAKSIFIKCD